MKVGVKAKTYREHRNFTGLNVEGYEFVKVWDVYKLPAYVYFRIFGKPHRFWLNLFWRPFSRRPKIYHFFNAINRGNQKWVVTIEGHIPRGAHTYGRFKDETKYIEKGIKRLIHPACHRIIAISEHAKQDQLEFLKDFPEAQEIVRKKLEVWHPPQELLLSDYSLKKRDPKISFVFVGADFFRKGGMEILLAFDQLLNEKAPVRLTIVSSMNYGDYASQTTEKDKKSALEIISRHPEIVHYPGMPNNEVIKLFKEAQIGLLPSYEETYGYSVLEAQAAGCPVITTNAIAFRELNSDECGWIVNLPADSNSRILPRNEEQKKYIRQHLSAGIYAIVNQILTNPSVISEKGEKALERIKKIHDPVQASNRLKALYDEMAR